MTLYRDCFEPVGLAMTKDSAMYNQLQIRELFHLEFLRWFTRKLKPERYVLKGGSNLRFFYKSIRYSEDMDLDIENVEVETLKDLVMKILRNSSFQYMFKSFGCERVAPPDISKAKQTQTTQRFNVHLISSAGEDLFTKIEFSRRGFKGARVVQPVSDAVLRPYKLAPLLVSHYDAGSAAIQKLGALAARSAIQARDVFDLYILSSQCDPASLQSVTLGELEKARQNLFELSFEQFRDAVVNYLPPEDQPVYNSSSAWGEVKLKVSNFIDELR